MKNTGITYTSAERSPVILPEMAELLPPLSAEQSAALEEDLLRNGCYAPIIVNEDMVIVDGHNRQSLCEKHGLPYTMAVFSFEDLLEAKQWALDTQKNRRNLEKWELGKIALKLKPEIEAKARANQGTRTDLSATLPESSDTVDTRKELAEAVGLGERTMGKVMQIDENAPEVIKEALDKKELSINKGYDLTRQLQDLPEEQREQAAAEALEYEKAKKELKKQDAEIDRKGKIAALFCKAYEKAVLLTPSEENVRCWTDGTRMTPEEMQDTVKESRELAEVFRTIADIPNASTCRSLELGMIRCLDEIGEQIRRTLGLSMTAAQMESVLRGDAVHINEDARKIIDRQADAYVHRLLSAITESGLDTRAMPAVFLGGGAALLKRNVSAADGLCRPVILDDVSLNAKGYERLAERLSKNDEQ